MEKWSLDKNWIEYPFLQHIFDWQRKNLDKIEIPFLEQLVRSILYLDPDISNCYNIIKDQIEILQIIQT